MERMMQMMMWMENVKRVLKDEKGQGMVEYGLILALVSIIAIVSLTSIGTNIAARFAAVVTAL